MSIKNFSNSQTPRITKQNRSSIKSPKATGSAGLAWKFW